MKYLSFLLAYFLSTPFIGSSCLAESGRHTNPLTQDEFNNVFNQVKPLLVAARAPGTSICRKFSDAVSEEDLGKNLWLNLSKAIHKSSINDINLKNEIEIATKLQISSHIDWRAGLVFDLALGLLHAPTATVLGGTALLWDASSGAATYLLEKLQGMTNHKYLVDKDSKDNNIDETNVTAFLEGIKNHLLSEFCCRCHDEDDEDIRNAVELFCKPLSEWLATCS